jgi:hypothetical protein
LRNQGNPLSLEPGCLQQADDVVVTRYGMVESRQGYGAGRGFSGCTDVWSPEHLRYGFVVAGGTMYQSTDGATPATSKIVASGLVDAEFNWASTPTGDNTFFAGASDAGWVSNGYLRLLRFPRPALPQPVAMSGGMPAGEYKFTQVLRHVATGTYGPAAPSDKTSLPAKSALALVCAVPAGFEADVYVSAADSAYLRYLTTATVDGQTVFYDCGMDVLQESLPTDNVNSWTFPDGPICGLGWRDGFLFAGVWSDRSNTTRIYQSREWQYQLWERDAWEEDQAGAKVTGKCRQIIGLDEGLLVMTDAMVGLVSPDMKTLTKLANYGTLPGRPAAKDQHGVAIHTVRGLRTFPPWDDAGRLKFVPNPGSFSNTFVGEAHGVRFAQTQTDAGGTPFTTY